VSRTSIYGEGGRVCAQHQVAVKAGARPRSLHVRARPFRIPSPTFRHSHVSGQLQNHLCCGAARSFTFHSVESSLLRRGEILYLPQCGAGAQNEKNSSVRNGHCSCLATVPASLIGPMVQVKSNKQWSNMMLVESRGWGIFIFLICLTTLHRCKYMYMHRFHFF